MCKVGLTTQPSDLARLSRESPLATQDAPEAKLRSSSYQTVTHKYFAQDLALFKFSG